MEGKRKRSQADLPEAADMSDVEDSESDFEFILDPSGASSMPSVPGGAAAAVAAQAAEVARLEAASKSSSAGSATSSAGSATGAPPNTKGTLDIDAVGTFENQPINTILPANLEEKPWRRPGADLSDYFNYGFDEFSWVAYCNRQDKLRAHFTTQQLMPNMGMPGMPGMPMNMPMAMPNMMNMKNMKNMPNMPNMPNMGMMPPMMFPSMMFPPQNKN